MQLRDYQSELVGRTELEWAMDHPVVLLQLATGGGKCLGRGTPVLMADGSTQLVETIRAGQAVMGPDSLPRHVLTLARGQERMYRICPTKGEPFVCNESHILSLVKTRRRANGPEGIVVNISVREYLQKPKTWRHVHKGYRSPAIDFPNRAELDESALPPYLLGLWLGDGHSDEPAFTTMDSEILDYLWRYSDERGYRVQVKKAGGKSFTLRLVIGKGRPSPFRRELRRLDLFKNKHIPQTYKSSSIEQRRALLAGLIDTDGCEHHGGFDYTSKLEVLARDVAWIARSLGLAAYVKESWKSCNGGPKARYWRVSVSGDCSQIPCLMPHKRAASRIQKKDVLRFGFTVEPLEIDDYFGFELTGDKLFVLGDFTVTHNTPILSQIVQDHNGFVAAIAHRDRLVEQMSLLLGRCGIPHDIIASDKTIKLIIKKHVKKLGRCWYVPGARCRVASIDTLIRRKDLEKWAAQVTLWVVDECFPAGTLVDGRPIETLKAGDTVTAFNEETGGFEPRQIVRTFKNKAPENMMRVALSKHHVIHCTPGHPFWTRRGWVEAAWLTDSDEVLLNDVHLHELPNPTLDDERIAAIPFPESQPDFLFEEMRDGLPGSEFRPDRAAPHGCRRMLDLRGASSPVGLPAEPIRKDRPGVLRQGLLGDLPIAAKLRDDGADEPGACVVQDDRAQPYAPRRDTRQGQCDAQSARAPTERARRQRQDIRSRDDIGRDFGRLGFHDAIGNTDQNASRVWLPNLLQDRCGQSGSKAGDRSGRVESQHASPASPRPEENRVSEWARLASVEIYKRRNSRYAGECLDDGHVYNIEVEGLHTYVAAGVVVHNCHHLLRANKWGKGIALFTHPQCKGLGLTATPGRPDGQGLGRHADGFADAMVQGPPMRWLIDEGYLCDYDVVCPPSDLRPPGDPPPSGEYSPTQQRTAARNSHIVGDVPRHYLRFAEGLSGITFCGDIETATDTVAAYRAAGVSAELITGDTDPTIRDQIFERSENGTLNQIVAVDVISEGVDIPALQVGSFARLTASIITWLQQLGRLLRPMPTSQYLAATNRAERLAAIAASPKPRALLIDHVGGFVNPLLGPPDRPRAWSLDRRDKRAKNDDDEIAQRVCTNPDIDCFFPYSRVLRACPKCGYAPEPAGRSTPAMVDGDLQMMDPAALAALQGRVLDVNIDRQAFEAEQLAKGARSDWLPRHWAARHADNNWQIALRASMDRFGGQLHAAGHADHEIQRTFFLRFGLSVVEMMALGTKDAEALKIRIDDAVNRG